MGWDKIQIQIACANLLSLVASALTIRDTKTRSNNSSLSIPRAICNLASKPTINYSTYNNQEMIDTQFPIQDSVMIDFTMTSISQNLTQEQIESEHVRFSYKHRNFKTRRSRSVSPCRNAPKLRHTNGRLHVLPQIQYQGVNETAPQVSFTINLVDEKNLELRQEYQSASVTKFTEFQKPSDLQRYVSDSTFSDNQDSSSSEMLRSTKAQHRFKIFYRDEALRENCAKNTRRIIENARRIATRTQETHSDLNSGESSVPLTNQQRLELKVLKYHNLLHRMNEFEDTKMNDPSFDVSECFGVQWCKA